MKRIFWIVLLVSALLSTDSVYAMADTVDNVTLDPGLGTGDSIAYRSDVGVFADSRDNARDWENENESSRYSLSPTEITLDHLGRSKAYFMVEDLFYGKVSDDSIAIRLRLEFESCEIEGKTIDLRSVVKRSVIEIQENDPSFHFTKDSQDEGRTAVLALYADPEDFAGFSQGQLLTGTLEFKSWWLFQKISDPYITIKEENATAKETYSMNVELRVAPEPVYTVSVNSDSDVGGTVMGGGEFKEDDLVTLTASAKPGYYLKEWKVNPDTVIIKRGKFLMPTSDVAVTGKFLVPPSDVTVTGVFSLFPDYGPAALTTPADLTAIKDRAFADDKAITIVDASNCTSIGPNAFKGCSNFSQIRLPKDCSIDPEAFNDCGTVFVFAPDGGVTKTSSVQIENCVFVPVNQK